MVKFFSQTHQYDESWQTVTLAFFLRYPNPFAAHVLSADVISRELTPAGTLRTTRLILKRGNVPKWLPLSMVGRSESWIVEQSEVDTLGRVMHCETKNLDHVRILSVREAVELRQGDAGSSGTVQKTEAKLVSQLGWLARRAERYGHDKFQRNLERSRAGMHLIVDLLNQSRVHALALKNMHEVGMGYRLPPLTVQGTALDSFRPRFYSSSLPSSSSSTSSSESGSASYSSLSLDSTNERTSATRSDDRGLRRWVPRPVSAWLWRSQSSSSPSSSSTPPS